MIFNAFQFFFYIDEISEIALLVVALLLQKCGKDGLSNFIEFIPVSSYNIYHYLFGANYTFHKSKTFAVN